MRSYFASLLVSLSLVLSAPIAAAQCRDARGEPRPCDASIEATFQPEVAPPPSVPEVPRGDASDEPTAPKPIGHWHRESESAYLDYAMLVEGVDTRQLHFSPMTPSAVAEMVRGSVATGIGTPFETALGGLTLAIGARPLPWLRLPQLRLSAGFGDLDGASVDMLGGTQPLRATFHELFYLRAELGGGFDLDFDPVRLYALAHVAIAGYFAMATIDHGTLAYRHVHTGVESNAVAFGLNVRFR